MIILKFIFLIELLNLTNNLSITNELRPVALYYLSKINLFFYNINKKESGIKNKDG
jgi:hypothetical protein